MSRLAWVCWALVSLELVLGLPLVCWWQGQDLWWPPSWIIGIALSLGLLWLLRRTGT